MRVFMRQLRPAVMALLCATVLTGVVYPLAVTAIGQVAFGHEAEGSLIERDGVVVGSELLGQPFADTKYLHPRPSAAGAGYDALASSGSNLGPTNTVLLDAIAQRVIDYRSENNLPDTVSVPVDAVTASASGLDPHISVANARLQAPRVAQARSIPLDEVLAVIDAATEDRPLGFLGDPGVNVLDANLALDAKR
ncbi:MAG: K(+)-transporting ATPase subunit C [Acidimicrobiia bacterium]